MKRLLFFIFSFAFVSVALATTVNLNWISNGNLYTQTTCTIGGDLNLPSTAPTPARGYHFVGWDVLGYTPLEYIESTGTQYIDTGLTAGSNTRILARYKLQNTGFILPISVRNENAAGAGFGVGCNDSQQFISDYNGDRKVFTTITPNTTDIITVDKNKNVCTITIGGQSETVTNTASTFTTTNTLPFFAINSAGDIKAGYYTFYSFKMWNNNTLVRDFVPAKNSSGVVGMYDTVSGQFFTNAGTGTFIAGPTRAIPIDYTELEYIESTGTQYIDTGIVPDINTGTYLRGSLTYLKASDNIVFGCSNASGFTNGNAFAMDPFASGFTYFAFGGFNVTDYKISDTTLTLGTIYDYKLNYMNDGYARFDDKSVAIPATNVMTSRSIFLFGCSYGGSLGTDSTLGMRAYNFKVTENTRIIMNLIPVKRYADNVIGMYDTVSGQFFTNQGTGDFIAGPEK